jgi:hypothetical protein
MKKSTLVFTFILTTCLSNVFAQIPNAGFEAWDSLFLINNEKIYDPTGWSTSNIELFELKQIQTVKMTTDAHAGNYAVKLTSAQDDQELQGTYLSSGKSIGSGPNDPTTGKFPLNGRINGFEGYYKYIPNGIDSFRIFLALYRDGQFLGQSYMVMGAPADSYTKFSWPVNFPSSVPAPDSAKFIIEPSVYDDSEGSVLYIDDLNLTFGFTMGIDEAQTALDLSVFPNPATDHISLLGYNPHRPYGYQIFDINGKKVHSGNLAEGSISISFLENGLYILTLENEEGYISKHRFMKN